MVDFYNPKTNSRPSWNKEKQSFNLSDCVHKDDMPADSKEWFDRIARSGYEWVCLNGKWPEEVPVQPPSHEKLSETERQWRNHEIGLTDRVFVADYGPVGWTTEDRQTAHDTIMEYRKDLKQWPDHPEFPNKEHRPVWPESVPRPAV
ncbi:hypothetical protein [Endozoicomonas ascidiicola]|uniref:hypothetical protein n=1 Tax=Endozoicomonas ascidiicola TaxID=1698521 RepID=UPI00082BA73E|nr:hypothetical protein [Endozoicomonas ascidiicola]